jgi:hypothetical protein
MNTMKKNPQAYLTIRAALAVNDPHAIIIIKTAPRKWVAVDTGGGFVCRTNTKRDAARYGVGAQAELIRTLCKHVRAYCGRTGKRLA